MANLKVSATEHETMQQTEQTMPKSGKTVMLTGVAIPGIDHPTVLTYFETLNAQDFERTAALFDSAGELRPPFEAPIVGPAAIASYLQQEAIHLQLVPKEGVARIQDDLTQIQVAGLVKTPLFQVGVVWHFDINDQDRLTFVAIRLQASLEQLLNLRRS